MGENRYQRHHFSIQLRLMVGHYKITAQQQANYFNGKLSTTIISVKMGDMVTLIITILGAFIGSLSAYLLSRKSDKTKLTLEFHKEFYGPEMSRHRRIADFCIQGNPIAKYDELEKLDYGGSVSVIIILMFFQRLWHCARKELLNNQMTGDLFMDIFCYWYCVSYDDNLLKANKHLAAKIEMNKLFCWLINHYTQTDVQELIETYKRTKAVRIENYNQLQR